MKEMTAEKIDAITATPAKPIKPYDHPDFIGGILWSATELREIERYRREAIAADRALNADAGVMRQEPDVVTRESALAELRAKVEGLPLRELEDGGFVHRHSVLALFDKMMGEQR